MLMSQVRVRVTTGAGIAVGHENVTRTHTHAGKGIKTCMGYPYLCQSLIIDMKIRCDYQFITTDKASYYL